MRSSSSSTSARHAVLLVIALCLSQMREVASRDPVCDDGSTVSSTCSFILPDPDNTNYCHDEKHLALQRGCFVCVDPVTCDASDFPESLVLASDPESVKALEIPTNDKELIEDKPAEARMVPAELVILPAHGEEEHADTEKGLLIYPQQAAADLPVGINAKPPAFREVSNWYFLVPAFLALISVGLALRGQIERTRQEFERVGDEDQDEINPFCGDDANPQADDDDLECGKHYDSDQSTEGTETSRVEL